MPSKNPEMNTQFSQCFRAELLVWVRVDKARRKRWA